MAEFKKALSTKDLPAGSGKPVEIDGKVVAVFNVGGKFFALENTCPHRGGPLGEGELQGSVVTCPWHGWQFDVRTGQSPVNPQAKQTSYPVKVEGDQILVTVG